MGACRDGGETAPADPLIGIGCTDAVPIASGGYSVVYRARQQAFDRVVAVKVLTLPVGDERGRRRFERELNLAGRLTGHPNVVTVFASGFLPDGRGYVHDGVLPGRLVGRSSGRRGRAAGPRRRLHRRENVRGPRAGVPRGHRPPGREAGQHPGHPLRGTGPLGLRRGGGGGRDDRDHPGPDSRPRRARGARVGPGRASRRINGPWRRPSTPSWPGGRPSPAPRARGCWRACSGC